MARAATSIPVRFSGQHRLFGTLPEILEVPLTGAGRARRIALLGPAAVPGPAHRRAADPARSTLPPRADAARQRRDAAGAGARPHLADSRRRGGDRRHARSDPRRPTRPIYAAAAIRRRQGRARRARADLPDPARGRPGGTLLAGRRVLARAAPARRRRSRRPSTHRSSARRSPRSAAVTPGSSRWIPRTGGLLALAGIAFSALQPPVRR